MATVHYKNNGGEHHEADGRVIKAGAVFASTDADLQKKFPNKFEKASVDGVVAVPLPAAPATPTPAATPASGAEDEGGAEGGGTPPGATADDVTKDFPDATTHGLTVRKDKAGFWVYDDTDPVNEKALRGKKAVEKAIVDYAKN